MSQKTKISLISKFAVQVMAEIKKIPHGKVATYKQIAELADKPHAPRAVAWILRSCSTAYRLPWHRVINSQGRISFEAQSYNFRKQKRLLEKEGVVFKSYDEVDMIKYQWKKKKKPTRLKKGKRGPRIFSDT